MEIYIPSLARADKQVTWNSLPESLRERTKLIVSTEEDKKYARFPRVALPLKGIGPIRQWVIDNTPGPVIMLDDDLTFATRREDDPTRFLPATSEEVAEVFDVVSQLMDTYVHGGIAPREGGNVCTDAYTWNVRCLRALFYRADILREKNVRFDRIHVMEDFDVALQLLRLGYPSLTVNYMVQNQGSSNAPGGCSTYRTLEKQAEAAHRLAELHPEFVQTVVKQTKTAWNGKERTDVRVSWKKAYNSSGNTPLLD